jgi:chitinase
MNSNKPITGGARSGLLAAIALLTLGGVFAPGTAAAAEFAAPLIYTTYMPKVDSVIANKPFSIAIKYKRVAGYLNIMRIYQDGFLIRETTSGMGNVDHGGTYFPNFADKTGWYWAWFSNITLSHTAAFPNPYELKNVYVETCYASPAAAPICKKSAANEFVVRVEYPFVAGDWATRLTSGPRDKSRAYTMNVAKHVGGYYTNWSVYSRNYFPKDIPVENLTHIYHAFLGICSETHNKRALDIENDNIAKGYDGKPYTAIKNSCAATGAAEFEVSFSDQSADTLKTGFDASETRNLCPGPSPYCAYTKEPFAGIYADYYRMKQALAAKGKSVKILVSIGGYSLSDPFFELAKTSAGRNKFVDSVTKFLTKYDVFDGVDIDWEFPGDPDNAVANEAADKANFVELMALLRTKLDGLRKITGKKYELTMAVGPGVERHLKKLDLAGLNNYVNRVNLMSYDYYGTWNNTFGHHAALAKCNGSYLQPLADSWGTATIAGVSPYIAEQYLNVGVASYGRAWKRVSGTGTVPVSSPNAVPVESGYKIGVALPPATDFRHYVWGPGVIAYKGIEKFLVLGGAAPSPNRPLYLTDPAGTVKAVFESGTNDGPVVTRDTTCSSTSTTDYLWLKETATAKGAFVTYESPTAAMDKGRYVKNGSLGGLFIWELAGDSGTLLNSIHEGLGSTK